MKEYDHLKKKLRHYTVEVDKEKIWQQTMHTIPKKKKRSGAALILFAGVLLLSSVLSYKALNTNTAYRVMGQQLPNRESNGALPPGQSTLPNVSTHSASETNSTASTIDLSTSHPGKHISDPQTTSSSAQKPFKKNTKDLVQTSQQSIASSSNDLVPKDAHGDQPLAAFDKETQIMNVAEATLRINHGQPTLIDPLPLSGLNMDSPLSVKRFSIKPAHTQPKNIFSLSLLQGFGISSLSLDANNPEARDMQSFISASTRSLESISTTLRGRMDVQKGFSFSAGIAYGQLTTETTYAFTRTERFEDEGTSSIVIDETGNQYLVLGNVGSTRYIDLEATRYTHHQSLAFEVFVHKTLFKTKHATVNGYVKGGYNAWYAAEGTAFTIEKGPMPFEKTDNPYHLSSPWFYGFGLDIQYHLTPKWLLAGAFGYDRKDIYHRDYDQLKWKHAIYSISLGIGYVL